MHFKFIKKYYFIEKFEKSNIDKQGINTTIIYRNYKKNYKIDEVILLKIYCKSKRLEFLLSNNIKLSIKLGLDGAYIPSFNKSFSHLSFKFKKGFSLIGSAHSLEEIRIKENQKVNQIFISSIFKKEKNYLGLYKFKNLSKNTEKKIIALGGINKKNLSKINLLDVAGIAGIGLFDR